MKIIRNSRIVARAEDEWGPLYIADEGNERSLHFSSDSPQSSMWLDAPFDLTIEYTQLMMASLLFIPSPTSVLLFGLGGGSLAKFLWKIFPQCHIHVVELRPLLGEWAHEHFFLPRCPRIHLHMTDAIDFVKQKPLPFFDLIVIDLFTKEGMSSKLVGHHFFELSARLLNRDGVVAWNLWQNAPSHFLEEGRAELCTAYGSNIIPLPSKTEDNLTLIALPKPLESYKLSALRARAESLHNKSHLNFPFLMYANNNFRTDKI